MERGFYDAGTWTWALAAGRAVKSGGRKGARPGAEGGGAPRGSIAFSRSGRRVDVEVDGIPYSTLHPDRPWSGYAWDAIAAAACWAASPRPSILLLGAGAGTVLHLLRRLFVGAELTAIELDERILEIGRERGDLAATKAEIVVGDALEYVRSTRRTFDVILDDLFAPDGRGGLGRPVADEEAHLRRVASRLRRGGVAATNVTTDGDPPELERAVAAAHRAVFGHRLRLSPRRGYNAVFVGSAVALPTRRVREVAEGLAADDSEGLLGVRVRRG